MPFQYTEIFLYVWVISIMFSTLEKVIKGGIKDVFNKWNCNRIMSVILFSAALVLRLLYFLLCTY